MLLASDYSAAVAQVHDRLVEKLGDHLKLEAPGMELVPDGQPQFDATSDHAVGAEVDAFTVTMTGLEEVNGFSERRVHVLLTEALDSQLGAGEQTTGDAVSATYEVVESTPDGFVKLKGTAAGVAIPKVTTGALQKRIASMRVVEARAEIGRAYPDASIQVRVSPAWMPWLPAQPARIEIRVGAFSPSSPV